MLYQNSNEVNDSEVTMCRSLLLYIYDRSSGVGSILNDTADCGSGDQEMLQSCSNILLTHQFNLQSADMEKRENILNLSKTNKIIFPVDLWL